MRGVEPERAEVIGQALFDVGVRVIEVPLNSPEPFKSISGLARLFERRAVIGAGTVLTDDDVRTVAAAGGARCISQYGAAGDRRDKTVRSCLRARILYADRSLPGAGGRGGLSEAVSGRCGPAKNHRRAPAVLPPETGIVVTGGVDHENIADFFAAGARAVAVGSSIFKPGKSVDRVGEDAAALIAAWRKWLAEIMEKVRFKKQACNCTTAARSRNANVIVPMPITKHDKRERSYAVSAHDGSDQRC